MKLVLRSIFVLAIVVALTATALFLLPGNRIADVAESQFEAITGRKLKISGDVSPTLFPVLGIRTGAISVANAHWADDGPLLEAEGLAIGVRLLPLLSGQVEIDEIQLTSPDLRLLISETGEANWDMQPKASDDISDPTVREGGRPPIPISLARAEGASAIFEDQSTGRRYALEDADAEIELPGGNGQGSLKLTGRVNGLPIDLRGKLEDPLGLGEGRVRGFDAQGVMSGTKIAFSGSLSLDPFSIGGPVSLEGGDLDGLARALAGRGLGLPARLIADPELRGIVTYSSEGVAYLRGGHLKAGPNEVAIDADLRPGADRPHLTARISSGRLDLVKIAAGLTPDGDADGPSGWSRSNLDASALALFDAEIRLDIAGLSLGRMNVGRLDATLNLDRSRLVTRLNELRAYGGRVAGQAVINGRGGLSLGGDLRVTDLSLQPLLIDFAGKDRLIAPLDLQIKYLAVGDTVDDLMKSLSGAGRVYIGKGKILGVDLPNLRTALGFRQRQTDERTIFESIDGSFSIDAGVLRNSDMAFASPVVDGTGKGSVDLGGRSIDYRLNPVVTKRVGEISVPIDITGPWSDITFRPNAASLVGQNLDAPLGLVRNGAKVVLSKVETDVKTEAFEQLGNELDAPVETTADVEDALEEKAVDELERGLRRLFD